MTLTSLTGTFDESIVAADRIKRVCRESVVGGAEICLVVMRVPSRSKLDD